MTGKSITRMLCLGALAFCLPRAEAVPVTYHLSEPTLGSGTFKFDFGHDLGNFEATDVTGSGTGFIGVWSSVKFYAPLGSGLALVLSDTDGSRMAYAAWASSGGTTLPGSTAAAEWEYFMAVAFKTWGITITEVLQSGRVPDAGVSLWLSAAVFGGLLLMKRKLRNVAG